MSTIYNLNGQWELVFDVSNQGEEMRWYATPPTETQPVEIPHTWEQEFGQYPGFIAFYFRSIEVPENFNPKRSLLRFGRSFFYTKVWMNGKYIGENMGGHNSFDIDISKSIRPGEINTFCIRVESESANRIAGTHISELPVGLPFHENSFGGLWGDLELIDGGKGAIISSSVISDIDQQKITLELIWSNNKKYTEKVLFVIKGPDREVARFEKKLVLEKENAVWRTQFNFKEIEAWTPESPKIYSIEAFPERSYSVKNTFGFRKFDIFRHEYFLNDQPMKLQGLVYNLSHPISGGLSEDGEQLKDDLKRLKKSGFNTIRTGGSPMDNKALEICDEIGLMVWQEMPVHKQKSSKDGLDMARNIIENIVNEQKSHPSLVAWTLGGENGSLMLENGTKLLKFVDELDSTRPSLSNLNSVYFDNEGDFKKDTCKLLSVTRGDKIDSFNTHRINLSMNLTQELSNFFANYFNPEVEIPKFEDPTLGSEDFNKQYLKLQKEATSPKVLINLSVHTLIPNIAGIYKKYGTAAKHYSHGKKLNVVNKAFKAFFKDHFQGGNIWDSADDFTQSLNKMSLRATQYRIDTFLSSPNVSGIFLDCWRDTNSFFNGLVNEFGKTKGAEQLIEKITKKNRLLLSGIENIIVPNSELSFNLRFLNGDRLGKIDIEVGLIVEGKAVQIQTSNQETVASVFPLVIKAIKAPSEECYFELYAKAFKDGDLIDEVNEEFRTLKLTPSADIFNNNTLDLDSSIEESSMVKKGKTLLSHKPSQWSADFAQKVRVAVSECGANLVLQSLTPEEMTAFNKFNFAPKMYLSNSTGSKTSAFHYFHSTEYFKGIDREPIADKFFAEIMPQYSCSIPEEAEVLAPCLSFTEEGEFKSEADVMKIKCGKGYIIIHQYRLISQWDKRPLAGLLLANVTK